jgi:hypothetical protein
MYPAGGRAGSRRNGKTGRTRDNGFHVPGPAEETLSKPFAKRDRFLIRNIGETEPENAFSPDNLCCGSTIPESS